MVHTIIFNIFALVMIIGTLCNAIRMQKAKDTENAKVEFMIFAVFLIIWIGVNCKIYGIYG